MKIDPLAKMNILKTDQQIDAVVDQIHKCMQEKKNGARSLEHEVH